VTAAAETFAETSAETSVAAASEVWLRENQRHLALAAGEVAALLEGRDDEAARCGNAARALAAQVRQRCGAPVAQHALAALFGLTGFEAGILLAAAAPELGLPAAEGAMTFGRALAALADAHWSALLPDAPLRRWRLLDLPPQMPAADRGGLQSLPLAADERILHALVGADTLDDRLTGRARRLLPTGVGLLTGEAHDLAALLKAASGPTLLTGEDSTARRQVVLTAATATGLSTLLLELGNIPEDPPSAELFSRLLIREAALAGRCVLIEVDEAVGDTMDSVHRHPLRLARRLAAEGIPTVVSAAEVAEAKAAETGTTALHLGNRPSRTLHGLAELRHPKTRLEELVIPDAGRRTLQALLAHVRQRGRVHGEWGYGRRERGLAVTALFTGASGTGKTTAAEAVAAELGLDLLAVDLSQVVSKYIGETEKNLAQLFDLASCDVSGAAGTSAGSVLLFDECDALFGKRSQVRDARDRYANIEVSYLLQRLETFDGIAILTSNSPEAIDGAFARRIRFVVRFAFPDTAQREQLWRLAFPAGVPTEGLEHRRLAQLSVSGGSIAQVALHAAFLAADLDEPVRMGHILSAAQIECDKLERPLSPNEVRGWA
jgi:hypothetical protein